MPDQRHPQENSWRCEVKHRKAASCKVSIWERTNKGKTWHSHQNKKDLHNAWPMA